MKNNQFAAVLAGLLLVSTLITCFQIFRYTFAVIKARSLQPRLIAVNSSRNLVQSLINDTLEYSKRNPNPDMNHLLQQVFPEGHPTLGTSTTPSKPATK
ncbi:hypothetical protein [Pedosphaera parvula]|uniref:Uncharacterized protein n=1 Tax=Pedosphaera parvula (strain Ellin514) TaxID=320771 RepID=B9XPP8_PEDPL|nr:hypothetical protein [Pedosphaera parvula]EEF58171.1 hypothetical protein Cflav_PD1371 [Pedosphaera parvula Ellin514]